ncbi:hypothetical protein BKA61DRAFT_732475 [Leptodontidium sp. MPI-SDFR-AT-0119]|nr:hypothetical protein BKA61DRAFT_732475 [Leptodontidium sp. MPI-SDFR-AT-0119]
MLNSSYNLSISMSQANSDILDTQSTSIGLVFGVVLLFLVLLGIVQVKKLLLTRAAAAAAAAPAPAPPLVPWGIPLLLMEPQGAVVRRHTLPARLPLARLQRTIVADEEARVEGSSYVLSFRRQQGQTERTNLSTIFQKHHQLSSQ